jgi:hypothetical protein
LFSILHIILIVRASISVYKNEGQKEKNRELKKKLIEENS